MFYKKKLMITALSASLLLGACGYNFEFFPDNDRPVKPRPIQLPEQNQDLKTPNQAQDPKAEAAEDAAFLDLSQKELTDQELEASAKPAQVTPIELTPAERLISLEKTVSEINKKLDSLAPAILKLSAYTPDDAQANPITGRPLQISPDIPESAQDKLLAAPINATPKDQVKKYTPKPVVQKAKPAPVKVSSGLGVNALRFGEYPTKTRIVLDLNGATRYARDLDNDEQIFIVELAKAAWRDAPQKSRGAKSAVKSYITQATADGGTRIIFTLRNATRISYEKVLPPGPNPNYRIVFDLDK